MDVPDDVLGFVEAGFVGVEFQIIPVRSFLFSLIDEQIRLLNYDLKKERQAAIEAWVDSERAACKEWAQNSTQDLESQHNSLHDILVAARRRVVDSCDSHSLEQAIGIVLAEKQKVLEMKRFSENLLLQAENNFRLPEQAHHYPEAPFLQKDLREIVQEVVPKSREFDLQITQASKVLEDEIEGLKKSLEIVHEAAREKARAEAEYAENMRSLNVGKLEERLTQSRVRRELLAAKMSDD